MTEQSYKAPAFDRKTHRGILAMPLPETESAPVQRQPVRLIQGAQAAPELRMKPVDIEHAAITVLGNMICQPKVDGVGGIYLDGYAMTQEGTPLDCATHCLPGLVRLEQAFGIPMMFDGEYQALEGYGATMSEFKRGQGCGIFWLYDAVPAAEWRVARFTLPLRERLYDLKARLAYAKSPFVGLVRSWERRGADIMAKAHELWSVGEEGLVAKTPGSPYQRARTADWVRIKETHTVEGIIADVAVKNGKLRSMTVRTATGTVIVGTGWTQDEGAHIAHTWAALNPETHQFVVEIAHQLTSGNVRSIRGARFIRLRPDKGDF